jgi:hypothetical protein
VLTARDALEDRVAGLDAGAESADGERGQGAAEHADGDQDDDDREHGDDD